ncbi:XRE family transcriptional regulator [Geobacillus phage vB_GthS_PK3.5]|nr:XRE family transcriptional regulator [Geobacillus phage vB_GthS_PK3.5]
MAEVRVKLLEVMAKKRIRYVRDLAKMTNLSPTVLYDLVNDKKRSIRLDTIARLCEALDCEIEELIEIKKDNKV